MKGQLAGVSPRAAEKERHDSSVFLSVDD